MTIEWQQTLATEEATELFARTLVKWLMKADYQDFKIYLEGNLGAGKTTFSRYFIQAFGVKGPVKSPTYTLIEPYELTDRTILHADLYRLSSPLELFDLGLLEEPGIWLIEWPEKGEGVLPPADITLKLSRVGEVLTVTASSETQEGEKLLTHVEVDA